MDRSRVTINCTLIPTGRTYRTADPDLVVHLPTDGRYVGMGTCVSQVSGYYGGTVSLRISDGPQAWERRQPYAGSLAGLARVVISLDRTTAQ